MAVPIPSDITSTLASAGPEKRLQTLRSVTDLFLRQAPLLVEDQVAVFDQVLGFLAERIERYARSELAERLADVPNAPPETILKLASDEIDVARPVLERSPRLSDGDLVSIALTLGRDHMVAIGARPNIGESVTDALTIHGDGAVAHSLSRNLTAKISTSGFGRMMALAARDQDLQLALGERADLPHEHLQSLLGMAKEVVRARLAAIADSRMAGLVAAAVDRGAARLEEGGATARRLEEREIEELTLRFGRGELSEADVATFAREGRRAQALAALALLASLPRSIADRVFVDPDEDLLLIVCKAIGLHWETVDSLQRFRVPASHRPYDATRLRDSFDRLNPATAKRVIRFLHAREPRAERMN
ncbi:hypothetical protein GCM10007036_47200 [Alsobacter metallidurans]|uniref:DUF2336 domain-containing protein n=1 Tax=Alsobacter metallidurans TaxID=340221 RepID=A0A917IC57_9HYPH|nr:DUF2336 domain-containing protein [Alsobacter metallidurans]GGH34071.1 hypothetical protein GCM10007036_47200 [Alsobacter metallidurans]